MSNETLDLVEPLSLPQASRRPYGYAIRSPKRGLEATISGPSASAPNLTTSTLSSASSSPRIKRRPKTTSYRSHFKQKYMVEAAWRRGGESIIKHITPDQGVVTSLHLTDKYIIVALDNAKIHVFNTMGDHQRTLQGHVMGVWAMVPWDNMLVSGGCDRDVRVWDMATGWVQKRATVQAYTDILVERVFIPFEATLLLFDVSRWQTEIPLFLGHATQP